MANRQEDRLSSLPDEILLKILSMTRYYKHAVRTSCLSKRWESLYTRIPELRLHPCDIIGKYPQSKNEGAMYSHTVSVALLRRGDDLQSLHLHTNDIPETWFHLAAFRQVQRLHIFANSVSSSLPIKDSFPFTYLTTCKLRLYKTVEDAHWIHALVSLSPVLRDLHFMKCKFDCALRIPSSSLHALEFEKCSFKTHPVEILSTSLFKLHFMLCNVGNPSSVLCIKCPNLYEVGLDSDALRIAREIVNQAPSAEALVLAGISNPPCLSFWKKLVGITKFRFLTMDFVYNSPTVLESTNPDQENMEDGNDLKQLKLVETCCLTFSYYGSEEKWFVDQILDNCPKLQDLHLKLRASISLKGHPVKEIELVKKSLREIRVTTSQMRNLDS